MPLTRNQLLRAILALYAAAILVALGSLLPRPSFRLKKGKTQPGSIAVVHIYGPIKTPLSSSAWGSEDADDIVRRLHDISEDDDIKAVLLRINSPGGTVGSVQEI